MASLTRATGIWKPPHFIEVGTTHLLTLAAVPVSIWWGLPLNCYQPFFQTFHRLPQDFSCSLSHWFPCEFPSIETSWDTILKPRRDGETLGTYRFRKSSKVRAVPLLPIYTCVFFEGRVANGSAQEPPQNKTGINGYLLQMSEVLDLELRQNEVNVLKVMLFPSPLNSGNGQNPLDSRHWSYWKGVRKGFLTYYYNSNYNDSVGFELSSWLKLTKGQV